jgi:hypothetical protein
VQFSFSQGEKIDTLAQGDTTLVKVKRNGFYFELLGNAGLYSINYERMWIRKPKFLLISRIGSGFLPNGLTVNQSYLYEQNFCYGKKSAFLEVGLAYTLQRKLLQSCDEKTYEMDNMHWGLFRVGVRFQSDDKGSILRIGILPIIYYRDSCLEEWKLNRIWAGLSYGLLF